MVKEVFAYFRNSNSPFICNLCAGDVPSLFKAKDFFNDIGKKMREMEKEMAEVRG